MLVGRGQREGGEKKEREVGEKKKQTEKRGERARETERERQRERDTKQVKPLVAILSYLFYIICNVYVI